jgi:hypothetical protein
VIIVGSSLISTTPAAGQQTVSQIANVQAPELGAAVFAAPPEGAGSAADLLDGLTVTPGLAIPLSRGPSPDVSSARNGGSAMATLTLRYEPRESWFATVTGYAYLEPERRHPWQGDYSYAFGYDDWRPKTLSLVYSNYGNNRVTSDETTGARFLEGTLSGAYKFNLPAVIAEPMLIDRSQSIGCRVAYNISAKYEREDGSIASDKHSAQAGCRYPIWRRAYLDWTVYTYLRGEQRSWDPDYTYGFGWFDWRPQRFSVQYSNYSGNRWPGRKRPPHTGRFRDGQVTLTWSHGF